MNAVAKITPSLPVTRFNAEQVDLIKRTICKGASDDELKLFLYQADKTGLDPLARQIYSIERRENRNGQWVTVRSIQVSIDGFRLIAERSGKYAGQRGPEWCGPDGHWVDVWLKSEAPSAARVGILRSDFIEPCWGVARFDAYAQKNKEGQPTRMWKVMADVMLAKCAESLALRKAFPQELSGLYTSEEMDQAHDEPRAAHPASPKLAPPPAPKTELSEADERELDRESFRQMRNEAPEEIIDGETGEVIEVDQTTRDKAVAWGKKALVSVRAFRTPAEFDAWYTIDVRGAIKRLGEHDAKVQEELVKAVSDALDRFNPIGA